jgi:hypothetical protein
MAQGWLELLQLPDNEFSLDEGQFSFKTAFNEN